MKKAENFRKKGTSILKDEPKGIGDFLNDSSPRSENSHLHIPTKAHMHKIKDKRDELGRLHIQIKQDLIDKLIETVYKRKTDPKTKKKNATQRAIIEEALKLFFDNMDQVLSTNQSKGNKLHINN